MHAFLWWCMNGKGPPKAVLLGTFWFGIQVVWTAVLGVVLQDRVSALAPHAVNSYALLAAVGACVAAVVQVAAGFLSDRRRARVGHRRAFYGVGVALAIPAIVALPLRPRWVGCGSRRCCCKSA